MRISKPIPLSLIYDGLITVCVILFAYMIALSDITKIKCQQYVEHIYRDSLAVIFAKLVSFFFFNSLFSSLHHSILEGNGRVKRLGFINP